MLDGQPLGTAAEERQLAKNWMNTAAQEGRNTEYYRNIVIQVGELLGPEAKTCDDGTVVDEVLCAKVVEVVKKRLAP